MPRRNQNSAQKCARKGDTMKDIELLDKLNKAYKDGNKNEFTRLCMDETTYEGAGEDDCALSLYVAYSTIGEDEGAYIGHLTQYATDEEKATIDALLERVARFEGYDDLGYEDLEEVPEAEKAEYEEYTENRKHYVVNCLEDLYWKYEDKLDAALIWASAETIIEDLEDKCDEEDED